MNDKSDNYWKKCYNDLENEKNFVIQRLSKELKNNFKTLSELYIELKNKVKQNVNTKSTGFRPCDSIVEDSIKQNPPPETDNKGPKSPSIEPLPNDNNLPVLTENSIDEVGKSASTTPPTKTTKTTTQPPKTKSKSTPSPPISTATTTPSPTKSESTPTTTTSTITVRKQSLSKTKPPTASPAPTKTDNKGPKSPSIEPLPNDNNLPVLTENSIDEVGKSASTTPPTKTTKTTTQPPTTKSKSTPSSKTVIKVPKSPSIEPFPNDNNLPVPIDEQDIQKTVEENSEKIKRIHARSRKIIYNPK